MIGILMTHVVARRERKLPFFFSRFKFLKMRTMRNTHFCFACLSDVGYTPGPNGEPTNHIEVAHSGYNGMEHHDHTHTTFVVGNADKYEDPWHWLEEEIKADFPCVVMIT